MSAISQHFTVDKMKMLKNFRGIRVGNGTETFSKLFEKFLNRNVSE